MSSPEHSTPRLVYRKFSPTELQELYLLLEAKSTVWIQQRLEQNDVFSADFCSVLQSAFSPPLALDRLRWLISLLLAEHHALSAKDLERWLSGKNRLPSESKPEAVANAEDSPRCVHCGVPLKPEGTHWVEKFTTPATSHGLGQYCYVDMSGGSRLHSPA